MVKRSKKSKSKRITLKQKHKVIRKVKEHHKKKGKEAKKLGLNKKRKIEKDPGIPNDWPFKEQELKALEERRAKALEDLEQKKAARKERARKRKLGLPLDDDIAPEEENSGEGKGTSDSVGVQKIRDSSERAFYKELTKVIEESDVILEVLDARDPLGTRCIDMEKMVLKAGPNKHLVLLLNKIDLAPRESVEKWLKYFREELPAVAFKCSTQRQKENLGWKPSAKKMQKLQPSEILQKSDCLGAETLLKLLKNYSRSYEIKKSITVGIIGLPNVGKSSLINSLKRCHAVDVGATPGLTRTFQEVKLDKNITLLDCPGVVMLRAGPNEASLALRNCKKIEKLSDPVAPVKEIIERCPAKLLVTLYSIPAFEGVDDFLQKFATVRGKLKKGGIVDVEAAARIVLRDWNEGKIPYYTMPPTRNQDEPSEAKIVSELGKEFNIDEVYNIESSIFEKLQSVNDLNPVEVPASSPLTFDETMQEEDAQPKDNKGPEDMSGHGVDEPMEGEKTETGKTKAKTAATRQNEKLFTADGILSPKIKAAEKKQKKEKSADAMDDDDYDFKVDYSKKGSTDMDVGDEDETIEDGNEKQAIDEVPMSGVNIDLADQ